MSIFAKIRSGKKAAEEHKAQKAAKNAESITQEPAPYRHFPKHAAQDAIAGTPGTADKDAIREANKQRVLYSRDTFYSASSPSLSGSRTPRGENGSRSSSRVRPALQDRRSHPGYASYQNMGLTQQERRSRANSRHGKSPLSSMPITPRDSSAASSSSSASSVSRNYNDPIEPSAPFSERLETISSSRSVRSAKSHGVQARPTLYTPRSDLAKPKPWELAAAKKAKSVTVEVQASEITMPEPAADRRGRFLGMGRKQQTPVAAC